MSKQLTIKVTDKQYDLLRRIAISDRYKLNDLIRLVFARGLEFQWCEDDLSFKKRDDEYTPEEQDQIIKNKEILNELQNKGKRLYQLSHEEEVELGYKSIKEYHHVGGYGDSDDVAHIMAEQLRKPLLDKETGTYSSEAA